MPVVQLIRRTALIYRVVHNEQGHIGNLKFANGAWKFKAIGYEPDGRVIPGGGPYTHRHNLELAVPDADALGSALLI